MMVKKIMIYPFDKEFASVLRHRKMIVDREIVSIVSPGGWGLVGKDAAYADGGENIGIIVERSFQENLSKCDEVLLTRSAEKLDFENNVYPKILEAIKKGKSIITTDVFDEEKRSIIEKECKNASVEYIEYVGETWEHPREESIKNLGLREIETPIISVMGVAENTQKFEVQLAVREQLEKMGYSVLHIGSKGYGELVGAKSFPKFMFSRELNETEKIKLFNNYVKTLELEERPDVIMIGVPGGIMKTNNVATNDFGVLAFEISQAVKIDTTILSVLYEDYLPAFFEKITQEVKYKFACDVGCFNYVNAKVDWSRFDQYVDMRCIDIKLDTINDKIKNLDSNVPIFSVLNKNEGSKIAEHLVDTLAADEFEAI